MLSLILDASRQSAPFYASCIGFHIGARHRHRRLRSGVSREVLQPCNLHELAGTHSARLCADSWSPLVS